jgi:hypothetical protein
MPEASPFWQTAFLVFVLVAIGWCIWNGWRIGVIRAAFSIIGLFAACAVGMGVGAAVGAVVAAVMPIYGGLAGIVVGTLAGLAVYVGVAFLSALLFKRTAQQRTVFLRMIYGGGGVLIGVFVGISVLWAALLFVRGFGGMLETSVENRAGMHPFPIPGPVARVLVKLKKSVEVGDTGKWLESIDVMPAEFYRLISKAGSVMTNPEALQRFFEYPSVVVVLKDPKIVDLTFDSEAAGTSREDQVAALLKNPKILQAASDPALIAKLRKIDIEKALDYALAAPTPAHPSHP